MSSRHSNKCLVIDTGPLIAIAHLDLFEVAGQLYQELYITKQVFEESQVDPAREDASSIAAAVKGNRIMCAIEPVDNLSSRLGVGETSSVMLAKKLKCPVMIDDKNARRFAAANAVPVIGSVGMLVIARRNRLIGSVGDCLSLLREHGYYLSDDLIQRAKQLAGD